MEFRGRISVNSKLIVVFVSVVLGIQLLALTAPVSSDYDVEAVAASASPVGGTFNSAPDVFIETNYYVDSLDVSDMNGDGANDFLVGGWDSLGGGVEIHLQTVPGAYSGVPDVQMQMASRNPNVATSTYANAVDANGDGSEDLAVVGWWTDVIRGAIYVQTTANSFEFSTNLSPINPRQIETGDVNGDGLTDLVVGDSSYIGIFLQNSSTGFNLYPDEMICLYDAWPYYLIDEFTIADFNEDGLLDVMMFYEMREGDPASGSHITGFRVAAFYQPLDGWPQFVWQDRPVTQPDVVLVDLPGDSVVYCAGMGVGDLNGDGHDDIATLVGNYYTNGSINIFPFDATIQGISTAACQTFTVGPVMIGNFPHHFDDLNQDGRDDLLFGYPVSIYYQMADGTISETPGLRTNTLSCRGLIVADMDGDGDKDIVGADAKSVNTWFDHTPSPPAPPSPGWGTPSLLEIDDSGDAKYPEIAVDESGNGIAVWDQSDGTRTNIWAARYAQGVGWGPAELIENDDQGSASYPDIAVDPMGNGVAVWSQYDGALRYIWANRYVPGNGWGVAQKIHSTPSGNGFDAHVVCDDSGNAFLIWREYPSVFSSRYVAGIGWTDGESLCSHDSETQSLPSIAVDAEGNAIAVWSERAHYYSLCNIWANRYVIGSGWGDEVLIETNDSGDALEPSVALDSGGNAIAVWSQISSQYPSQARIWANRYIASIGWGTERLIDIESTDFMLSPRVAMDDAGNAIATWYQIITGVGSRVWTNRYLVATGWRTAEQINVGNTTSAYKPDIGMDEVGHGLLVWGTSGLGMGGVFSSSCSLNTSWEQPQTIAYYSAEYPQDPRVAVGADGNSLVVWFMYNTLRYNVYASVCILPQPPPPSGVNASVDFDPNTLNPRRMGKWVTVYIELPAGYDVGDILIESVVLNGRFPATGPYEIKDFDKDRVQELMVRFDWRKALRVDDVTVSETMTMTVSGFLKNGTAFQGSDDITIVPAKEKHSALTYVLGGDWNSLTLTAALLAGAGVMVCAAAMTQSRRIREPENPPRERHAK